MPDSKISALPSATVPLAGTEVLPIVQGGTTDKVTAADLLRQNGQTVTTSNPVLSLAQTWNAGGVTFTGMQLAITDTASSSTSLLAHMTVGGGTKFKIDKDGTVDSHSAFRVLNNGGFISVGSGVDLYLYRDAANTWGQRNGTNAQTFRVYNTYTDASNYERGVFDWSTAANALTIGTQKAGTGATRVINFSVGNAQRVQFGAASATLDVGIIFGADNTYDIGAVGANRPRSLYVGTDINMGGTFTRTLGSSSVIIDSSGVRITTPNGSTGSLRMLQSGITDNYIHNEGASGNLVFVADNGISEFKSGTEAQSVRVYKTFTDGANYERGVAQWNSTVFEVGTEAAGTGTIRGTRVKTAGVATLYFQTSSLDRWAFDTSGNFAAVADNIYDIGASGANRPRNIFTGTGVTAGTYLRVNGTNAGYIALGTADDVVLNRDAANTLALRNGTAAQTFNVYNTYTDASNYERLSIIAQSGNDVRIQTAKAGTGTARSLLLGTDASVRWLIGATSGHFLAGADNTYDIGASGATRPRNVFIGSALTVGTNITMGTGNQISCAGAAALSSVTDGIWLMTNNAGTNFTRLQFGGTTSSFPSLKRSGTELQARLADDSGDATLTAGTLRSGGSLTVGSGTAIPAGGNNGIGLKGTSTANFGVFFGSGAPTLSAAKGSLYLRSDGTTTNDRMYVNTDGSTTWTAVTTAA